jgi:biopolymer transport protein ExbB
MLGAVLVPTQLAHSQQANDPLSQVRGDTGGQARIAIDAAEIQSVMNDEPVTEATATSTPTGIDLLSLIVRGGIFMIPIGVMSLMVVALAFERLVSLRRQRILPRGLARDMNELTDPMDLFDPSAALQSCREYPSPAARVIKAMLHRTGQPLSEIEQVASETIQREADKCGSPIRWLTLAAAATPLMGLLGTVWGMIVAFHESTTLTPDRSRSEQLSEGIYTALVTTLAGLIVAIPAAILALYLENRLAKLFHRVEELVFDLAPGFARFTGHRRMDQDGVMRPMDPAVSTSDGPKPPPPRTKKQHDGAKAV